MGDLDLGAAFRCLAEVVSQIVWYTRPDGMPQFFNSDWYEYTGAGDGTPVSDWIKYVHADDRERMLAFWNRSSCSSIHDEIECRLRRADGQYRSFQVRVFAIREAGVLTGWCAGWSEIEERSREELEFLSFAGLHLLELKTEDEILAYVGKSVSALAGEVIVFVSSYDPRDCTTTLKHVSGADPDRGLGLIGRSPVGLSYTVSEKYRRQMLPAKLNEVPTGIFGLTFEELPEDVCRHIEREFGIKRVYGMPFAVREDLLGVLAILSRTEHELRHYHLIEAFIGEAAVAIQRHRAEEALREADRRKDEFLAVLSHELRNPLAPIRNSVYVLERAAPGGEQARRSQAVIERQVSHLARLVDDLLDVTRITRGKIQLKRERTDLVDVVRRCVEDQRPMFAEAGVRLGALVSAEPMWLDADTTRLAQVVGNLLSNSVKFTPRGGRVDLTLEREQGSALLRVRDTGVGIATQVLDRLFEPFMQAQQTLDRTRGGLGLGLALVKGLVELHGGTVSASSPGAGSGAEFTVRIPLDTPVALPPERTSIESRLKLSRRILVIEDHLDAASSLREALELGEHNVEVAHAGMEGVTIAREFHPDVILCDIGLPGMDGYEVAREIRSDPDLRHTCLVALTGYALPEDLEKAREAGFDAHLAKPPDLKELDRLLGRLPRNSVAVGA